jgi:hypothetical protein
MKITVWVREVYGVCPPAVLFVIMVFSGTLCSAQFRGVLTWHNDNARTGQNLFDFDSYEGRELFSHCQRSPPALTCEVLGGL